MKTLDCCIHPSSDDAAIILTGKTPRTITHAALAETVTRIGQQLQSAGLCAGKRIAIVLSNPYLFTLTFLSTTLQACIAGPLNHNSKQPEFESFYKDFKPDVVILNDQDKSSQAYLAAKGVDLPIATISLDGEHVSLELPELVFEPKQVKLEPTTQALILYTSGTTGNPKAVPLTHGNLSTTIVNIREHYKFTPKDRTSVIMPLFHIHGIVCALLTPLAVGAAIIFSGATSGITPSFLRDAVKHEATWYTAQKR